MADGCRHLAQRFNHAGIDPQRRIGRRLAGASQLHGILLHILGQFLVGPPARLAPHEQHRQGDIARLGEGVRQAAVGIQFLIRLEQESLDLRAGRMHCGRCRRRRGNPCDRSGRRRDRCGRRVRSGNGCGQAHTAGLDQLVDINQTRVALRLGVEHGGGNHLGLGGGEFFHHLGHDFTRPGPASDIGDALLVDRNHRHLVRGRPRSRRHALVIRLALQTLQQFAIAQNQHDDADHNTEEPVSLPEASLLHRSIPCMRALMETGQ